MVMIKFGRLKLETKKKDCAQSHEAAALHLAKRKVFQTT
jgi:hypothetical protein